MMEQGVQASSEAPPVSNDKLGSLSGSFESGNDPGKVAKTKGDIGGASYGSHQLTTASGHAQKFADSYGGAFNGLKAGTAAFDKAWKSVAAKEGAKFASAQYDYMIKSHYTPAANALKKTTGIDVSSASQALKETVLSIGVQHGAAGAASIFKAAGITSKMSNKTIISKLYDERSNVEKYFKSSSKAIQTSVKSRFAKEKDKALSMLAQGAASVVGKFTGSSKITNKVMAKAVDVGNSLVGKTTYKLGGGRNETDIKNGVFDCSSFIHYALKKAGKDIGPLNSVTTDTLKNKGTSVSSKNMKPGDLVFFDTYKKDGHVGIYMGDGKFMGAQTSTGVGVADMNDKYWSSKFSGNVRRV